MKYRLLSGLVTVSVVVAGGVVAWSWPSSDPSSAMAGQQPTPTPAAQQPAATSPDDLLARGDALFTEGLFDRALARYKEAQSLAPSDLRVQNRLAQTHLRLGNRGAGLAALGSIFAAKPELKDNADLVELRRQLDGWRGHAALGVAMPGCVI